MIIHNKDTSNPDNIEILGHAKKSLSSHAVLAEVQAQIKSLSFKLKNSNGNNLEKGYNVIEVETVLDILSEHFR